MGQTFPDTYLRRVRALKAASAEVGYRGEDRLEWAVKFSQEDPAAWDQKLLRARGDALLALARPVSQNLVGGPTMPPPLKGRQVHRLHAALKDLLEQVVTAGRTGEKPPPVRVPATGFQMSIVRFSAEGTKPADFAVSYSHSSPMSAVLLAVASLVVGTPGRRLIACGWCRKPLLATRKRQFCDDNCAQKMRNDRKASRREDDPLSDPHRAARGRKRRT